MKNIIIIVSDALRCKNLSLFGYDKETDKNLKKISDNNILFKQHFSTANFTFPSLVSLFTSRYPNNHGLMHQFPFTTPEETQKFKENKFWFPSYLKQKGYSTIGIGWSGPWLKKGFDYYKEKEIDEKNLKIKTFLRSRFMKKILLSLPEWIYKFGKKIFKIRASSSCPPANEIVDLAISKINNTKNPFFLFMHFESTHFPFIITKKMNVSKKNNVNEILKSIKSKTQREYVKKRFLDASLYSMEDIINKYDVSIKEVDEQINRFVNFLKEKNLWDDIILVFLADHGISLGEHNIYFSGAGLYDETIHVPLIMKLPGIKPAIINELVQNIDIVPTILDYLKENKVKKIDGLSLLPLIKKNKAIREKILASDSLAKDVKTVRTKTRKIIIAKDGLCYLCKARHSQGIEEYDLIKDPNELKNIYSEKSKLKRPIVL